MTPEQRALAAAARFGPIYQLAERTVRECGAYRDLVGELHALTLSARRNVVERQPYYQAAYFDFDYAGSLSVGRITVALQHLQAIAAGNPAGHPARPESLVGGSGEAVAQLFIYPGYAPAWSVRHCPLPAAAAGPR